MCLLHNVRLAEYVKLLHGFTPSLLGVTFGAPPATSGDTHEKISCVCVQERRSRNLCCDTSYAADGAPADEWPVADCGEEWNGTTQLAGYVDGGMALDPDMEVLFDHRYGVVVE